MTNYYENEVIHLKTAVTADVIGEGRSTIVPAGTIGSVVVVHLDSSEQALAYEVEFYLEDQSCYALATIEAGNL